MTILVVVSKFYYFKKFGFCVGVFYVLRGSYIFYLKIKCFKLLLHKLKASLIDLYAILRMSY